MNNLSWALRLSATILDLGDADELKGQYLNELKEISGRECFTAICALTGDFGMSAYKRRKLMKEARDDVL